MEMKKMREMSKAKMQMQMSIASEDEETAIFSIYDDIGDGSYTVGPKSVSEFLAAHPAVKHVEIHINSYGGDLYGGIAIYNLLKHSGKEITTWIDGIAASAASIIAMAGDLIMPKTSQLMIHNAWTICWGNAKQLRSMADELDKAMASARHAYLQKAGDKLDEPTLMKLLDEETYLSADEALAYGLADAIPDDDSVSEDTDGSPDPEEVNPEETKIEQPSDEIRGWFFHG